MASDPHFPAVPPNAPASLRATPFGRDAALNQDLEPEREEPARYDWRVNAALFALTVLCVFMAGQAQIEPVRAASTGEALVETLKSLGRVWVGWTFAVPLLSILLAHEFGHFIAAKVHRVPASLPYFIPLPFLSLFGTMGAIIAMPNRIRSRNALLDIGAAGPLAGMVVALPVLVIGLSLSTVGPSSSEGYIQEGQSLLYAALKYLVLGPIPNGHDVHLHPTAFAGWTGLLITMINLLPWGQLDGGHIAYALFGSAQHKLARVVRWLLLPLFVYNLIGFMLPVLEGRTRMSATEAVMNSLFWLVWFAFLGIVATLSQSDEHPPTEPGELSRGRRVIAIISLLLFIGLFMPTPLAFY